MKRIMIVSACVAASGLVFPAFALGTTSGKDSKPMDMSMCEGMMKDHKEMMGKDHMGMKGGMKGDMPKECAEMMEKHGMGMKGMAGDKMAQGEAHRGVGVVKKVDAAGGKITLQHEPIKSIGWPAMTMAFGVKDKTILNGIKPDQKVEFSLAQQGSDYVITSIK